MSDLIGPNYDVTQLPYRVAVLCYLWNGCGDDEDRLLMLHRNKQPNADMVSPIGGKVEVALGETPHECALREIVEEAGVTLKPEEVRLLGVVAEKAYEGEAHWLLFMFEAMRSIEPEEVDREEFDEGRLEWIRVKDVVHCKIPETDSKILWPMVQRRRRGGFFMIDIDCGGEELKWRVIEDRGAESPVS